MSQRIDSMAFRAFALGGWVVGVSLAAPAPAQAPGVAAERMLLNLVPDQPLAKAQPGGISAGAARPGVTDPTDGTTALLGHVPVGDVEVTAARVPIIDDSRARIDGEPALLGRGSRRKGL